MIQNPWCPELAALGYTNDLPRPCNMAIQAVLASIQAHEIHTTIIEHERDILSKQDTEEQGQCFMLFLGIEEWCNISFLAVLQGTVAALCKLEDFESQLW